MSQTLRRARAMRAFALASRNEVTLKLTKLGTVSRAALRRAKIERMKFEPLQESMGSLIARMSSGDGNDDARSLQVTHFGSTCDNLGWLAIRDAVEWNVV
jgi:hypothetical protein